MIRRTFLVFILAVFHFCMGYGQNQSDTITYRIETNDGSAFVGHIIAEDSQALTLKTAAYGEIKILRGNIKSKVEVKEDRRGNKDFWLPNVQSSSYFLVPNAYGLEKGSAYYKNVWILFNQFTYGIADNFSIGAGTVPLFLFGGSSTPFWITPKLSIPLVQDQFNLAAGALLGTVVGEDNASYGILYGTSTFGSRDKNVSLGLAYGFADDEWMNIPVINISGMFRTGPKGYFITENHMITSDGEVGVIFSAGGRSMIRNVSLDYSLWIPFGPDQDSFVAVPFLGLTVPIGRKK
ncbi:MAG: hypothetical protein AB2L20_23515 [Mangrovibacterium sp.]